MRLKKDIERQISELSRLKEEARENNDTETENKCAGAIMALEWTLGKPFPEIKIKHLISFNF